MFRNDGISPTSFGRESFLHYNSEHNNGGTDCEVFRCKFII
jgi:hypothetical protein